MAKDHQFKKHTSLRTTEPTRISLLGALGFLKRGGACFLEAAVQAKSKLTMTSSLNIFPGLTGAILATLWLFIATQTYAQGREYFTGLIAVEYQNLPSQDRELIQRLLSYANFYNGAIDGVWGPGTQQAIVDGVYALEMQSQRQFDLKQSADVQEVLELFLGGQFELFILGEGEECDGCDQASEANLTQPVSSPTMSFAEIVAIYEQYTNSCPEIDNFNLSQRFEPAHQFGWSNLGADRSLMFFIDNGIDEITNGNEEIFQEHLVAAQRYPEFPPLNFNIAWGFYNKGDLRSALEYFSAAARQGDPNAAGLLGWMALNAISAPDFQKLYGVDRLPSVNPFNMTMALKCLEFSAMAGDSMVAGVYYQNYFGPYSAVLLTSVLLRSPTLADEWKTGAVPNWPSDLNDPQKASQILDFLQRDEQYIDFVSRARTVANRQLAAINAAAEEAERARNQAMMLTEAELQDLRRRCSQAITLIGICWDLNIEEMQSVLVTRGYNCEQQATLFGGQQLVCRIENKSVRINRELEQISFNCHNFGTCDYSFNEVVDLILSQQLVGSVTRDQVFGNNLGGDPYWTYSACGRGDAGDQLCVSFQDQQLLAAGGTRFELSKSNYGAGAPSFD